MAQQGELIDWNDERGFGFIRPDGGQERLFVHISQIGRIATRPRVGDRVSFGIGPGRDGKSAAVNVRIAGANPIKGRALARGTEERPRRRSQMRAWVAAGLSALLLIGAFAGSIPPLVLASYLAAGVVSLSFYADDKRTAQAGGWRTSEVRLHGIDLACGIIGGLLAQQLFRHKTAKPEFAITTYVIAAVHGLWLAGLVTGRISVSELTAFIPG